MRTCPAILKEQGLPSQRDSVLIVVGRHWCLAVDRDYTSLDQHTSEVEALRSKLGTAFVTPQVQGGGPAFVDNLLGEAGVSGSAAGVEYRLRRRAAEDYVSLEGSYGVLPELSALRKARTGSAGANMGHFVVQRSTQPWLEGTALPLHAARLQLSADGSSVQAIVVTECAPAQTASEDRMQSRLLGEWEVLECSFTADELSAIFNARDNKGSTKLKSRL